MKNIDRDFKYRATSRFSALERGMLWAMAISASIGAWVLYLLISIL